MTAEDNYNEDKTSETLQLRASNGEKVSLHEKFKSNLKSSIEEQQMRNEETEKSSLMNPSVNSFKADDITPPSSVDFNNEDKELYNTSCDHVDENEEYNSLNKRETSFYVKNPTIDEVVFKPTENQSRALTTTSKEPLSLTISQENEVKLSRTTSPKVKETSSVKEPSRTISPEETSMKSAASTPSPAPPKPPRLQDYADMIPLAKVICKKYLETRIILSKQWKRWVCNNISIVDRQT